MSLAHVISVIRAAYASRSYRGEPLEIPADSELNYLLEEVHRFESYSRDQQAGDTPAETDERAVLLGGTLLRAVRLADSISILENHAAQRIAETLWTLARLKHGNYQHEAQFDDSEYELHVGSQFVGFGQRVSFIQASLPSRYMKRVEFMIGYKWPVECKRPHSERRILDIIDEAIVKIDERKQTGLVCIGLEAALPMPGAFLEALDANDIRASVSEHLEPWLLENHKSIQQKLGKSHARFAIFTYTVCSYMHDCEQVCMPSLRLGLSYTGDWIASSVTGACISALKEERAMGAQ